MTAATDPAAESAVRQYLLYVKDPASLRDDAEIDKRTQAVADATDPIEKLKALAALERVTTVDEKPLRAGFVAHAKVWAEANDVPSSAFGELKVPDDVLRDAGFAPPANRRGRKTAGTGSTRAKAVPVEDIKAHVAARKDTFLLIDVITGFGGSPATVRKAVDELIESGQVTKLGPDPDYHGRGRSPHQYKAN